MTLSGRMPRPPSPRDAVISARMLNPMSATRRGGSGPVWLMICSRERSFMRSSRSSHPVQGGGSPARQRHGPLADGLLVPLSIDDRVGRLDDEVLHAVHQLTPLQLHVDEVVVDVVGDIHLSD